MMTPTVPVGKIRRERVKPDCIPLNDLSVERHFVDFHGVAFASWTTVLSGHLRVPYAASVKCIVRAI